MKNKETLEEVAHSMLCDYGIKSMGESINVLQVKKLMIKIAEWQQERMYSEEDMKQFGLYLGDNLKKLKGKTIDKIFEQFKKK